MRQALLFGPGSGPIHLDDLRCRGDESNLLECYRSWYDHDCDHSEDAGAICFDGMVFTIYIINTFVSMVQYILYPRAVACVWGWAWAWGVPPPPELSECLKTENVV